ncbi:polysaccharide biosynthesis tyrosine autokinase [Nonlabens sp.]|uniref:polysaccharide biosynthesis tyrosine autokinase n=1 Tax=Nonlabens sp. TaxID=1888209 RepID=UPI001BCCD2B9|nr:tyrosine-protein kinase domain-containing protein [Nonlabens sp.]
MEEVEKDINSLAGIFDIEQFLLKLLKLWWLFFLCIGIACSYAYYKNQFIQTVYSASSLISIKDNSNPLFTSNTSLTFNWGGTTDKVTTAIVQFKSRTHAEQVVDELQFYINYIKEGDYYHTDAYKQTPFFMYADSNKAQLYGKNIRIKVKDQERFELSTEFPSPQASGYHYGQKANQSITVPQGTWKQEFQFGDSIQLPFLNAMIEKRGSTIATGGEWLINFGNYWGTVHNYKSIAINPSPEGSSILLLSLSGGNKQRLIDYINTSSVILERGELERKNKFAVSTIRYIDSSLVLQEKALKKSEQDLEKFKDKSLLVDALTQNTDFNKRLTDFEIQERSIQNKINYYNNLKAYLKNKTDYTVIQAPSVVGIEEGSISSAVARLINLSEERKKREFAMRADAPVFREIDRDINAIKEVIYENIKSSNSLLKKELGMLYTQINQVEGQIKKLPKEQQEFLRIQRQFDLDKNAYNVYMSRKAEAELVKAANVSDVYVIDEAKDTGGGGTRRDSNINYLIALLIGLAVPISFAFVLTILDNFIHSPKDIEKLSPIPTIGVVGKARHPNNLVVKDKPKSTIAESFRGIRSSLHFIYNQESLNGSRTIMLTSSVSGEGKTFTSINLATVFALSGKRTLLIGLDLRKPKIFDDFGVDNDLGVSNYLVKDCRLRDIVRTTGIEHLDIVLSGPVPPNPSELIMSRRAGEMIEQFQLDYDYIILDTPPLGLVADALEIAKYVDATLYVVRQGYTKKGMLDVVNEKYQRGEIKNLSFVFNYFKDRGAYGYGYGYGSGYGYGAYGNGYHEDEKRAGILHRIKEIIKGFSRSN